MDIMRGFGIPVPKGGAATSVEGVGKLYKDIIGEGNDCVIKAMVLTGASFPGCLATTLFVVCRAVEWCLRNRD